MRFHFPSKRAATSTQEWVAVIVTQRLADARPSPAGRPDMQLMGNVCPQGLLYV